MSHVIAYSRFRFSFCSFIFAFWDVGMLWKVVSLTSVHSFPKLGPNIEFCVPELIPCSWFRLDHCHLALKENLIINIYIAYSVHASEDSLNIASLTSEEVQVYVWCSSIHFLNFFSFSNILCSRLESIPRHGLLLEYFCWWRYQYPFGEYYSI